MVFVGMYVHIFYIYPHAYAYKCNNSDSSVLVIFQSVPVTGD